MNSNIQIIDFGTPLHDELIQLRNQILRVPLGMVFEIKDIEKEYDELHLGYLNDNSQLIGSLNLRIIDAKTIKMRQVCVLASITGQGIGTQLVNASEKIALSNGFKTIELNARENAVHFYTKLSYQKTGKPFEEVGIKHIKMIKKLQ